MEGEALWVEGVGWIGQYHNYLETLWEKGVPYFCRDYYFQELQQKLDEGVSHKQLQNLIRNVNLLNSKILAYEQSCRQSSHRLHPKESVGPT
jgi:hypothetical protein